MSDNSLEAIIAEHVEAESEQATEPVEVEEKENTVEEEAAEADSGEEEQTEEVAEDAEPEELPEVKAIKEGMQKRIDRQTAAYRDLQEKYAELERKISSQAEQPKQTAEIVKPNIDDYDTMADYEEAVEKYTQENAERLAKQKLDNMQREMQEQQRMQEEARNMEVFNQRVDTFKQTAPDFDEKAGFFMENADYLAKHGGGNPATLDAVGKYLQQSENGPQLVYELANNPDKMEAIAKMNPFAALETIFKMRYTTAKRPAPASPDKKPLPKPVKGLQGSGKVSKSLDEMSGAEILKTLGV